jgi:hypothetical protein
MVNESSTLWRQSWVSESGVKTAGGCGCFEAPVDAAAGLICVVAEIVEGFGKGRPSTMALSLA